MTSFSEYLMHHARTSDTPEGEFIQDSRVLIELGKFSNSDDWMRIEWFMIMRNACPEALAAGYHVHSNYRRWLASKARP